MEGYWCYWHGGKGYSGVALHVSKAFAPERPAFSHPAFDFEHRIVTVDCSAGAHGRVDLRAERRQGLPRQDAVPRGAWTPTPRRMQRRGRTIVLCGDLNVARTDRDVHPKERKPRAIGQLPEERALIERIIGRGLVDVGRALDPDNDGLFTWWPPWREHARSATSAGGSTTCSPASALAARATACPVQKDVGTSDHAPVMATFTK